MHSVLGCNHANNFGGHSHSCAPFIESCCGCPVRDCDGGARSPFPAKESQEHIATGEGRLSDLDHRFPDYQHAYWDAYTSALSASGIDPKKVPFVKFFNG